MHHLFAVWIWDPSPIIFTIPKIHWPVTWYGLFFAVGFYVGYHMFVQLFSRALPEDRPLPERKKHVQKIADSLLAYTILGTVIGARLFHILFYEYPLEYILRPLKIFKTWEGGLASHGGILGLMAGVFLFYFMKKQALKPFNFLGLMDFVGIPTLFVCSLIRLGNFVNQEILGLPYNGPFAVLFLHPTDDVGVIPRHPVQLYESFFYMATAALLFFLWKKFRPMQGRLLGIGLIVSFTFRFLVEFIKTEQSTWLGYNTLLMGQYLSFPMIAIGLYVLFCPANDASTHDPVR